MRFTSECFAVEMNFCKEEDDHTFEIPILDLSEKSSARPFFDGSLGCALEGKVDGSSDGNNEGSSNGSTDRSSNDSSDILFSNHCTGEEYPQFLELPMFNGGKNGEEGSPLNQEETIGTMYLVYDGYANIVCVAAHLNGAFLKTNVNVRVEEDDDESWIHFGSIITRPS